MKVALLAIVACAHPSALSAIELVESVPTEARLDNPDIPNADAVWLDMITHATRSLYFAEFYASNEPDSKLEPIVQAIEAALVRGMKVRFLVERSFVKSASSPMRSATRFGSIQTPPTRHHASSNRETYTRPRVEYRTRLCGFTVPADRERPLTTALSPYSRT
jgi:hypothetical protein